MNNIKLISTKLSVRHAYVLELLRDKGRLSMTAMGGSVVSLAHITQIVDKLDNLGLVKRVRSKSDRRVVYCQLTPKGEAFASSYDGDQWLKDKHGLTDEDIAAYHQDMQQSS